MSSQRGPFASYTDYQPAPRAWRAAVSGSLFFYGAAGLALVAIASLTRPAPREQEIELAFVEEVAKPPPPPPPLPEPAVPAAAQPAPAAAPVVPPTLKVRKLDKPPPKRELVVPQEMPLAPPKEAEPSEDQGVAVYGEPGAGDAAGLEGGTAIGLAGGQVGVVELPDGATAPVPLASNRQPPYPRQARRAGKIGLVRLRIVILADGSVTDVQLEEGEEPFAGAAVAAVKSWRYQPARFKGVPISVYRLVRIRFELND